MATESISTHNVKIKPEHLRNLNYFHDFGFQEELFMKQEDARLNRPSMQIFVKTFIKIKKTDFDQLSIHQILKLLLISKRFESEMRTMFARWRLKIAFKGSQTYVDWCNPGNASDYFSIALEEVRYLRWMTFITPKDKNWHLYFCFFDHVLDSSMLLEASKILKDHFLGTFMVYVLNGEQHTGAAAVQVLKILKPRVKSVCCDCRFLRFLDGFRLGRLQFHSSSNPYLVPLKFISMKCLRLPPEFCFEMLFLMDEPLPSVHALRFDLDLFYKQSLTFHESLEKVKQKFPNVKKIHFHYRSHNTAETTDIYRLGHVSLVFIGMFEWMSLFAEKNRIRIILTARVQMRQDQNEEMKLNLFKALFGDCKKIDSPMDKYKFERRLGYTAMSIQVDSMRHYPSALDHIVG